MNKDKVKKVLVVDDDPMTVKMISKILKSKGFEVVVAGDGIDAMVQIISQKPDLIILDIMMPEINGYDVCRHVKGDEGLKHVPIIVLSARKEELDLELGRKLGIQYLNKPFLTDELLSTVGRLIG